MRVRRGSVWMLTTMIAAAVALSGCSVKQSLDAQLTPKPTTVTVEATVAAVGAPIDGTLNAGFPDTLPMWPGAKLIKSKTTKTAQGKSHSATLKTGDSYADVVAGVGKGLEDTGWTAETIDASSAGQKVTIIMISNADDEGIVTVSQTASKPVQIEYVIAPKN